jgi:hypothetical protein
MASYLKDPAAQLDYTIDWGAGYIGTDTITTSTWSILPIEAGGLVIAGEAQSAARVTVTLRGGVPGHLYHVANQVVISNGLADERSITVRVEQR